MTTKAYSIFCIRKANRNAYVHGFTVMAESVKQAKGMAFDLMAEKLGAHAFNLTNGKLPTNWCWDYISEHRGLSLEEIAQRAYGENGWAIYA